MRQLPESRHVSISIRRPAHEVYRFASEPENLPRWASGLGGSIRKDGGEWIADGPMGAVKVRFAEPNELGILDHEVELPTGETFYNPLRVVPNGAGSEMIFTLFRPPDESDEKFAQDAELVATDLQTLKELLERIPSRGKSASEMVIEDRRSTPVIGLAARLACGSAATSPEAGARRAVRAETRYGRRAPSGPSCPASPLPGGSAW